MIGYHYTTWKNWKKIQREGIRPYWITNPQLQDKIGRESVFGIWVWKRWYRGRSHVGNILRQMSKGESKAVFLKVKFEFKDILQVREGWITFPHEGFFHLGSFDWRQGLRYHNGKQVGFVLTKPVAPENLKCLEIYDFSKAFYKNGV